MTARTECRMLCERWENHLTPPPRVLRSPSPQKQLAPRLAAKAQSLVLVVRDLLSRCAQDLALHDQLQLAKHALEEMQGSHGIRSLLRFELGASNDKCHLSAFTPCERNCDRETGRSDEQQVSSRSQARPHLRNPRERGATLARPETSTAARNKHRDIGAAR